MYLGMRCLGCFGQFSLSYHLLLCHQYIVVHPDCYTSHGVLLTVMVCFCCRLNALCGFLFELMLCCSNHRALVVGNLHHRDVGEFSGSPIRWCQHNRLVWTSRSDMCHLSNTPSSVISSSRTHFRVSGT